MKLSNKNIILTLIFFCFTLISYAQNPFKENTTWGTSERIDDEFEEITFWKIDSKDITREFYYQIQFKPDNKFEAYNIPGCGMDCVVRAYGNFSTTDTTAQFTIDKTMRFKRCSGEDIVNKNIGIYHLIKDEYSLRLVKNFDDEPKQNYFDSLNINISDFNDNEAKKIIEKYRYVYNRIYQIVANKNSKKYMIAKSESSNWTYESYKSTEGTNAEKYKQLRLLIRELDNKLKQLYDQIEPRK